MLFRSQLPCPACKSRRYPFVTAILHVCTSHRYGVPLPLHCFFRFRQQSCLLHFGGIAALCVVWFTNGVFHFSLCQLFHCGSGLLVQRTAPKILRDRVEPLRIDFLDGMVGGKLPLLPATEIPDLTAGTPAFVFGSQTVTVP